MKRFALPFLVLCNAALQWAGMIHVIMAESARVAKMPPSFGVGPGPDVHGVILTASSFSLFLAAIFVWSRREFSRVVCLLFLIFALACNAIVYTLALLARTGGAPDARTNLHAANWLRMNYWEWWFFLSCGLMIISCVLIVREVRKARSTMGQV